MEDASAPLDRGATASGGAVSPAARQPVEATKVRSPEVDAGERFELRDPFSEVTYNSRTWDEMVSKAARLGAHRFVAIDTNGRRSFVEHSQGEWQRRPAEAPDRQGLPDVTAARQDAATSGAAIDQAADPAAAPAREARPGPDVDARAIAAAERAARVALLERALQERYIIQRAPLSVGPATVGQTEYRFRGDSTRVAFTESTFKLTTDTNSPSVARSMVDVAQARSWSALRVSGHEDFKRQVWLEASVRGLKAIGYEPDAADLEVLRREREARQVNRIERASPAASPAASEKSSARGGGGGRKAVLAAIDAVLVAKGVAPARREAVMTAAGEKLAERMRKGQAPKVNVYDRSAPSRTSVNATPPEQAPSSASQRMERG